MQNISIAPSSPDEADVAARLTFMAYHRFSYDIFGQVGEERALINFKKLWIHNNNRFSHRFSYTAKAGSEVIAIMTCYPSMKVNKLVLPTLFYLIRIGKSTFLWHFFTHLINFYYFALGTENMPDEFYIATLSVLPEYRNKGIGAEMLKYAIGLTGQYGYKKCSLHVNAENDAGIRFYERNKFVNTSPKEKNLTYYRMVYTI